MENNANELRKKRGEIGILIELIKMNEQNTNIKLDTFSERLESSTEYTRDRFEELKEIIKDVGRRVDDINIDLKENAIKPMKIMLDDHHDRIRTLQEEQKVCIKSEICRQNEETIKEYFWNITKKVIYFNLAFCAVYVIILMNSNTQINWGAIFSFIGNIF